MLTNLFVLFNKSVFKERKGYEQTKHFLINIWTVRELS